MPESEPPARERTVKTFTGDVIPKTLGFFIAHHGQTIGEAWHAKPMNPAINKGCQTDTAVAWGSIRDKIGFTCYLTLDDMMIHHL